MDRPLDPDIAAVAARAAALAPLRTLSVAEARARGDAGDSGVPPGPRLAVVEDVRTDGGVPVRLYSPSVEPVDRCLVYLHGGGWSLGTLETLDGLCRELADGAGCAVVSVDYRLAPEHPFPAGLDDLTDVWKWVHDTGAGGRVGRGAIVGVGGDSAGGNLAAALVHRRREPRPAFQLLLYPLLDSDLTRGSYEDRADAFPLDAASVAWFWDLYLPDRTARRQVDAAPLRDEHFADLPTTAVVVAGHDPLRDEGLAYARALMDAGTDVRLVELDDLPHSFVRFTAVSEAARAAQRDVVQVLRDLISDGDSTAR